MTSTLVNLELARNSYGRLIREAMVEIGVDVREAVILRLLASSDRGVTISAIRTTTGMAPSTVTSVVGRLVADGLVVRYRTWGDRRHVWLEPTAMGATVGRMVGTAIDDLASRMREQPLPDLETLDGLASALHELTAPYWGDPLA